MFRLLYFILSLFRKRRIDYINGSIYLPEPLDEEDEKRLINESLRGDIKSRNKLIEHNLRLVVYIAKRFESPKTNIEDLISIGSMGLIKGVETFKSDKNIKLATYASRCIENEILMFLRKISRTKVEVSLDETLNIDSDGNELLLSDILGTDSDEAISNMLSKEKERLMYEAIEKLKPREKEIIGLRFGLFGYEEKTQKEVADLLGISQSYISRLEKRIIAKLKHDLDLVLTKR